MTESEQQGCSLFDLNLPPAAVSAYSRNGITTLFPWQYECLRTDNVLSGQNIVYSAPTGAGKTLVSEILLLKRAVETRRKALFILPFVSVAREKMYALQKIFRPAKVRVGGAMGTHHPPGGLRSCDVCICTIEKANSFVNRMIEEGALDKLCCLVVDELHMLGDPHRGYLLELLLTKVVYLQKCWPNIDIQIIGMSAVLPNLDKIAQWLNAALYKTDYRPVPLKEMIKMGRQLNNVPKLTLERVLRVDSSLPIEDPDCLLHLVLETVSAGHGVVVFCPSKKGCEALAGNISRAIFKIGRDMSETNTLGKLLREVLKGHVLQSVLDQLKRTSAGLDAVLSRCVPYGVAYHHAGLTFDERDIIEAAFRQAKLRTIVATSTLSCGVNLPARRVIIRTPMFFGKPMDYLTYKQMIGRAGRKGIDSAGESILFCRENELSHGIKLVRTTPNPIQSCLRSGEQLKRALLEVIAAGAASGVDQITMYAESTLSYVLSGATQEIDECVAFLMDNEFITTQRNENDQVVGYHPTPLAKAVLASSLSPDDALFALSELKTARQNLVLENDLHITYQVTPFYLSAQIGHPDWMLFWNIWEHLSESEQRVGNLVGVTECFITMALRGCVSFHKPENAHLLAIHQRFYVSLALSDLIKEIPLGKVSEKYMLEKGLLQSLQQSAAVFAGMVGIFCKKLGWNNLEIIISQFQRRLHFGVEPDLCGLLRLMVLTAPLARILYNAGFVDLPELASAELTAIEEALRTATPTDSGPDASSGKWIILSGFDFMTESEAAKTILESARRYIEDEFGVQIVWTSRKKQKPKMNSMLSMSSSMLMNLSNGLISPDLPACKTPDSSRLAKRARTSTPVRAENNSSGVILTRSRCRRISLEPYNSVVEEENTPES